MILSDFLSIVLGLKRDKLLLQKNKNMASIKEKHKEIFDFLMEKHRQNPELRFLVRRINKGGKLDKGFWFYGSDTYLDVSFWDVWENHTSVSMGFRVFSNGISELFFKGKDNENKARIFDKLANTLGGFKQGTQNNNTSKAKKGDNTSQWYKRLEGDNYLKNLEDFIAFDLPVINSILKREDKDGNLFPFITDEKFEVSLARIKNWQFINYLGIPTKEVEEVNLPNVIKESVKLLALRIENIKRFSSAYISLDSPIVCFYGKNGTGKTTLLRSIAVAIAGEDNIGTFNSDLTPLLKIKNIDKDEVHYTENAKIELTYTVDNSTKDAPNYNSILMTYKAINKRLTIKNNAIDSLTKNVNPQAFKLNKQEDDIFKTLMIGFAQQGKDEQDKGKKHVPSPNINDLEYLIYDISDSRFQEFITWVGDKLSPEKVGSFAERQENREQINAIFSIINEVTGDEMILSAESTTSLIKNKSNPNGISLSLMSQGYQNVVGWVGFFIKRLWEVAKVKLFADEDFMQMPAICLIDEIDTYLHPEWQYRILSVLSNRFPNVQFIVTSHSPFVLSSIPQEKILLYELIEENGEIVIKEETKNLYGAQINDVALEMGTTKRFGEVNEEVEGLLEKVFSNDTEGAKKDLAELEIKINSDDSDLRKAATLIKSKEMFKQSAK